MMTALPSLLNILQEGPDAVRAFVANTPLSDSDGGRSPLVAIFAADPAFPNGLAVGGAPFTYTLKIASGFAEQMFALPACRRFRAVRIVSHFPCVTLELATDAGIVTTNIQELSRTLSPWLVTSEPAREAAFASLTNAFERPAPRPKRVPFQTRSLGRVTPGSFDTTWDANPIAVPFFDNRMIPVVLGAAGLLSSIVPGDADLIDDIVGNYLARGPDMRAADGTGVLKLCHDFLDAVGAEWPLALQMLAITDPVAIWAHVFPVEITVYKDTRHGTPPIYVVVGCQCDWEEEHGLQLVYRNGNDLIRVSDQDGNIV